MNVISFFTGAGGLDLGLESAGFRTVLAIESDPDCRATIRRNRPHWNPTDLHGGDITKFFSEEILQLASIPAGSFPDVIAGGPPCQSFSNIGNRSGLGDMRGSLVLCYADLVSLLKPLAFVFENVQGILQHPEALGRLSDQLGNAYQIKVAVLNAADYGVPQHRRRVIVFGNRHVTPSMPWPTHCDPTQQELGKAPWVTLGEALAAIPRFALTRKDNYQMKHAGYMVKRMARIAPGENFHSLPLAMRPTCWKNGKHQGADTFGRLRADQPSVTIRTSGFNPTKGRYIHPSENRGLSTAEMAAIQTFPPEYEFEGSIGSVGRQIGNAVPPRLGARIGEVIMRDFERCSLLA